MTQRGAARLEYEWNTDASFASLLLDAYSGKAAVPEVPAFRCACAVWLGTFEDSSYCASCGTEFEGIAPLGAE